MINMYKGIKSRIVNNGSVSDYYDCMIGVRQGENLSPFLFGMFFEWRWKFSCSIWSGWSKYTECENGTWTEHIFKIISAALCRWHDSYGRVSYRITEAIKYISQLLYQMEITCECRQNKDYDIW